jgi:protoheme IX farnesyltransferase
VKLKLMSVRTDLPEHIRISMAGPSDYVALLKPRVMSLVVFTALTGMVIAPQGLHPLLALFALIAIAVGAGASGAFNMWYDADIDALMSRTKRRPIPSGAVTGEETLAFGLVLSGFSVLVLGFVANWLAAGLLAFTIFFYAVIYTMWLKRSTPQNIVIGGAAGAFPPMIGYAAMSGTITLESCVLFLIIFIWTPPHFWALALVKSADYEAAGIPMMPNIKGADRTRLEILLYTIVLAPVGLLPWIMGFGGLAYGLVAIVGGLAMLILALRVYKSREGAGANKVAMQLFGGSILYLFVLFAVLLLEHLVPMTGRLAGWIV